ncbi:helix-turn-helix domain-containing protein [Lewinella sp. LCG006]|uniref:helix-turn-helix domain-containing protein n=1 Tax=Lewinella sp. LCG006 TaxID=3231911 RepID=UPI0034614AEC
MNTHQVLYNWIGNEVSKLRRKKRLSQAKLAELTGLSRSSVSNIEKGRQQSPLHVLWQIAEVLGVPITDIIPTNNEHETTLDDLIGKVDQMPDLDELGKEKLSEFLKDL